mmetsp:Transcript_91624/g.259525  ORF Transcript_91624/g.259525 Transcript_91624/m.259525 type:complete len:241 (-) Transcript_91624:691-1413(-)
MHRSTRTFMQSRMWLTDWAGTMQRPLKDEGQVRGVLVGWEPRLAASTTAATIEAASGSEMPLMHRSIAERSSGMEMTDVSLDVVPPAMLMMSSTARSASASRSTPEAVDWHQDSASAASVSATGLGVVDAEWLRLLATCSYLRPPDARSCQPVSGGVVKSPANAGAVPASKIIWRAPIGTPVPTDCTCRSSRTRVTRRPVSRSMAVLGCRGGTGILASPSSSDACHSWTNNTCGLGPCRH